MKTHMNCLQWLYFNYLEVISVNVFSILASAVPSWRDFKGTQCGPWLSVVAVCSSPGAGSTPAHRPVALQELKMIVIDSLLKKCCFLLPNLQKAAAVTHDVLPPEISQ